MKFLTSRFAKIALCLAFMLATSPAWAQRGIRTVGDEDKDVLSAPVATTDGGYAVVGSTYIPNRQTHDVLLSRYDNTGKVRWTRTYGAENFKEVGSSVVNTLNDGFWIAGTATDIFSDKTDGYCVYTDANGIANWERRIAFDNVNLHITGCVATADKGVILVGYSQKIGADKSDIWVAKLSEMGLIEWSKNIGSDGDDEAYRIIPTNDNAYAIVGVSQQADPESYNGCLIKMDGKGSILWMEHYGIQGTFESLHDVTLTTDGGFLLSGSRQNIDLAVDNAMLIRTDSKGKPVWAKTFGVEITASFNSSVTLGEDFASFGYLFDGNFFNLIGMGVDAQGNNQWVKFYSTVMVDEATAPTYFGRVARITGAGNGELLFAGIATDSTGLCKTTDGLLVQTDLKGVAGCNELDLPLNNNLDLLASGLMPAVSQAPAFVSDVTGKTLTGTFTEELTVLTEQNLCSTCTLGSPMITVNVLVTAVSCPDAQDGSLRISTLNCSAGEIAVNSKDYKPYQSILLDLPAGNHTLYYRYSGGCEDSVKFTIARPNAIDFNPIVTQPSQAGNDGMIVVADVTGGTQPFTYALNNDNFQGIPVFQNLIPGTYRVRVKDKNGCISERIVVLTDANGCTLEVQTQKLDILCANGYGSIFIQPKGGELPYTYKVNGKTYSNPFADSLSVGTYIVEVTDKNGCIGRDTVDIIQAGIPIVVESLTSNLPGCGNADGSILIAASGGNGKLTYTLPPNSNETGVFNNLNSGKYIVTISDEAGCVVTNEVSLYAVGNFVITPTVVDLKCFEDKSGEIHLKVTGGNPPYTYQLDNELIQADSFFKGVAAGMYNVTVFDASNCALTQMVMVNQPDAIVAIFKVTPPLCPADTNGVLAVEFTIGGQEPMEFSLDGTNYTTDREFKNLRAQENITVYVKDANGCTAIFEQEFNGNNLLKIDSVQVTDASCGSANGTIAVFANGAGGFLFSIDGNNFGPSPLFTNVVAGTYNACVRDLNGCLVCQSNVEVKSVGGFALNITASQLPCVGGTNGSISAIAGGQAVQPVTYTIDGGSPNQTGVFNNLSTKTYRIKATDKTGCATEKDFVLNNAQPIRFNTTQSAPIPANGTNGRITVNNVTGGKPGYLYWLNGVASANPVFNNLACGEYRVYVTDASNCVSDTTKISFTCPGNFSVNTTPTAPTCFGLSNGSISVSVSGGTTPFRYKLNGGTERIANTNPFTISGQSCGDFTLSLTDKDNNSKNVNGAIPCPAEIVVNVSKTDPSCATSNDGTITVDATGGTGTLTYGLDTLNFVSGNTFTGLKTGNYTVCVKDANGCRVCSDVTLSAENGLTITSVNVQMPDCDLTNGRITVNAEGTNLEYSLVPKPYQPSNVFTNVGPGLQVVLVRKKGTQCTASDTLLVFNKTNLDLSVEVVAPSCNAGNDATVTVTAQGGIEPYQYSSDGGNFGNDNVFPNLAPGNYVFYVKDGSGCTDTVNAFVGGANAPTINAELAQPTCSSSADGSATLTATGGTAPYLFSRDGINYNGSNAFNALAAGNYTFYVKDNSGCVGQLSIELTAKGGVQIDSLDIKDATCSNLNGSVTISASNGSGNYRYYIGVTQQDNNPTFTGLRASNYRISVLDLANGCFDTRDFVIATRPDLDIQFQVVKPSCTNPDCGGLNIIANGGVPPYSYSTDGLTYGNNNSYACLPPNKTYLIYVKDFLGCTDTASIFIPAYEPITFTAQVVNRPGCGNPIGGEVEVTAQGGSDNFIYELSGYPTTFENVIKDVRAGSYTLIVRDFNSCVSTDTLNIEVTPLDSVKITTIETVNPNCGDNNGFINVIIAPDSGTDIEYSIDGDTFQTSNAFASLVKGTYTVYVRNSDKCVTTQTVVLSDVGDFTTDIVMTNAKCAGSADGRLEILGVTGGIAPYRYSLDNETFTDSSVFDGLAAGKYTLYVKDSSGCPFSQKIEIFEPSEITVSTDKVLPTCWGRPTGVITVNAMGGTSPYSYSLDGNNFQASPVFDKQLAGEKTVYVLDANVCRTIYLDTLGVEGNKPAIMVTDVIIAQPRCEGVANGRARIVISGGTAPVKYRLNGVGEFQLNPTFLNLAVGSYFVEVLDADSCGLKDTARFTVGGRFPNLIKDVVVSRVNCNSNLKASVTVVANNTFEGITYSLDGINYQSSNVFTNVENGEYTVFVKYENGCTATREITVIPNANVTIESVQTLAPKCVGAKDGIIQVKAVSTDTTLTYSIDGATFQSENTFRNLADGAYTVTVRSNSGCLATRQVTLDAPTAIVMSSPVVNQPSCGQVGNGSIRVFAEGGVAPITYVLDGGAPQAVGEFKNLQAGIYVITAMDANGCKNFVEVRFAPPTGPAIAVTTTEVSTFGSADGTITIKAVDGKAPYTYSVDAGINFSTQNVFTDLAEGLYTVVTRDDNGCETSKIVRIGIANKDVCPTPKDIVVRNITLTSATIMWQPVNGASRYDVRYRLLGSNDWSMMSIAVNSAELKGLRPNFLYEVQVRTQCASGITSSYSNTLSLNTSGGCDIPLITDVTPTDNSLSITWAAQPGVIRYVVSYRSSGGGFWKDVNVNAPTSSILLNENIRPQTRYSIRIKAVCELVESPWSFTFATQTVGRLGFTAEGETSSSDFQVYPNPTKGNFDITFNAEENASANVTLFDLTGRLVMNATHNAQAGLNTLPVSLNGVASGVYSLRVNVGGTVKTVRLVVE